MNKLDKVRTTDESLDIIAQSLQLMIEEKKETNRLLDVISGHLEIMVNYK